jgi:two-component system chemotaxis response regulator CheB
MKVVGTAGDGRQALEILDSVRPDVVTLDIQMPNMDGLATLDAILARRPVPVVMVSSLTKLDVRFVSWQTVMVGLDKKGGLG